MNEETVTLPKGPDNTSQPAGLVEESLRRLEFNLVQEKLAGYTSFLLAQEMAQTLVLEHQPILVAALQQETTEARRFLEGGSRLELEEAQDVRVPLERAALGGVLNGEELWDVCRTLKATRIARTSVLRQKDTPALRSIAQGLPVLRDLERNLANSIGASGEVLDTASPVLKSLRAESRAAYQQLNESLERILRRMQRQNILQEPIITQRNGRLVLLVKTEMKHRLPGIVHDVSDSGATLFVEPMSAIALGNRWRELRLAEEREQAQVLRVLSNEVEAHHERITSGLQILGRLDLAMAKGRYSIAIGGTVPTMIESESQYIWLMDARHPLLEGGVVPITVKLGEGCQVMLITGPNAGGKTVALKTIGLLSLMAQAGLHVPVREATLSLFDGVYADIGDQQSILRSLSTFSSHIQTLQNIVRHVTNRSLVLIDELGTSTDPQEGAALAKSILDYFRRQSITLVATTHQQDVAAYVQGEPEMMNASVELDPQTLAPTYRLTLGLPGRSYALTIASRLGLEPRIVGDAHAKLSPTYQQAEGLLKQLQEERQLAEVARHEAEKAKDETQHRSTELEEQLAAIEDQKAEALEGARHQLQQKADDLAKRLRAAERTLSRPAAVPSPDTKGALKEVQKVKKELRSPVWQPVPSARSDWLKQLKVGDRVFLRGIPQPVEVIGPPNEEGTLEVLLGTMRARLPASQVDRLAPVRLTASWDGVYYTRSSPARQPNSEVNLQGERVEHALEQLETYLDDAVGAGLTSVRIVHGVGTGALRAALRERLDRHPLVKSFEKDEDRPNDSATLVELT